MDQKFCRSCGFGLGKVARLIAEQASGENPDSDYDPKEEMLKKLRYVWFGFVLPVFLTFSAYSVASDHVGVFWNVVFIFLQLLMLTFLSYIVFGRKRPGDRKSPRPASSTNAPTTKKLEPQPDLEISASVTEQTTANLAEKIEN
jgi:hypothetical protein